MICPRCGSKADGGKFCGDCGCPLPWQCGGCGSENPPGKKFCRNCGAATIGSAATAVTVTTSQRVEPNAGRAEHRQLTIMFADMVGSTDKQGIMLKGGHVSLVAGPNAIKRLWPNLVAWLGERST